MARYLSLESPWTAKQQRAAVYLRFNHPMHHHRGELIPFRQEQNPHACPRTWIRGVRPLWWVGTWVGCFRRCTMASIPPRSRTPDRKRTVWSTVRNRTKSEPGGACSCTGHWSRFPACLPCSLQTSAASEGRRSMFRCDRFAIRGVRPSATALRCHSRSGPRRRRCPHRGLTSVCRSAKGAEWRWILRSPRRNEIPPGPVRGRSAARRPWRSP
mmetsp:Transcript_21323/g.48090  ORF Transcript_21323/g.48090 Transcript_21323/m.48090 type:complete len:213 (-) Transcript_21323:275-913(-)